MHTTDTGVAPLARTDYCSAKGVRNETKKGAYPPEFRQQMVELVRVGRKPIELAQEFGCHETSISAWVRQAKADEMGGSRPDAPLTTAERQELAQLRRQLRQVTQERDILAKATAWFANKESAIDKRSMR
jgi:transposase